MGIIGVELQEMVSQVFCGIFCATLPFGNRCFGLIPCAVLSILGNMLCFNVGSKEAFQVSLADVSAESDARENRCHPRFPCQ